MTAKYQLVIDCADPEPLARFWVAALGHEFEPPPDGYDNWDHYWRAVGVSEDELGLGLDRIADPAGRGPRIWFQVVPPWSGSSARTASTTTRSPCGTRRATSSTSTDLGSQGYMARRSDERSLGRCLEHGEVAV
jgi:hypothetical protein